jgi:hypothetical protein
MKRAPAWGAALLALGAALFANTNLAHAAGAAALAPLDPRAINLVFVPPAEANPATGALTPRGLNRAIRLGPWLAHLSGAAADGIYALAPATHLVGPKSDVPDLAPLATIEPFALLYDAPVAASTAAVSAAACAKTPCQGIDYADKDEANEALVERILQAHRPGMFVFAAPPATLNRMMRRIAAAAGWKLALAPLRADDRERIVTISLAPGAASAALREYRADVAPPSAYPNPGLRGGAACLEAPLAISSAARGLRPPAGVNRNETVYFIRHAEAHPTPLFENGNLVCQGEWRALGAGPILIKKIGRVPDFVYASDPSQPLRARSGAAYFSYVRPALTLAPFAAEYGAPLRLASDVDWWNAEAVAKFFFFGGAGSRFDGKTVLVAWEHLAIGRIVGALLHDYRLDPAELPRWNRNDYDTIWKVRLDDRGNLTFSVDCEGIPSGSLPPACPLK